MIVAKRCENLIYAGNLWRSTRAHTRSRSEATFSSNSSRLPQENENENEDAEGKRMDSPQGDRRGMSERLSQLTEDAVDQGGRGAKNAINEGGFSEELKKRLEARIQDNAFKSENPAAFAELNLPVSKTVLWNSGRTCISFASSLVQAKEPAMSPWQSLG